MPCRGKCFSQPTVPCHPDEYTKMLTKKIILFYFCHNEIAFNVVCKIIRLLLEK